MNCDEARQSFSALVDGELDPVHAADVERHLAGCAACRAEHEWQRQLRSALREALPYHSAPPALRARILAAARAQAPAPATRRPRPRWDWGMAFAAGVALTLAGALLRPSADDGLERELVASHVRSLMAEHLSDVASSDRHTVKPWFAGKLDFSPPVFDLAAEDFPLVGGRLDYVGNRAVAALVYKHRAHVINLFVWPAQEKDAPPAVTRRSGYSLVRWTHVGMAFAAVSDLNAAELTDFARREIAAQDAPG